MTSTPRTDGIEFANAHAVASRCGAHGELPGLQRAAKRDLAARAQVHVASGALHDQTTAAAQRSGAECAYARSAGEREIAAGAKIDAAALVVRSRVDEPRDDERAGIGRKTHLARDDALARAEREIALRHVHDSPLAEAAALELAIQQIEIAERAQVRAETAATRLGRLIGR